MFYKIEGTFSGPLIHLRCKGTTKNAYMQVFFKKNLLFLRISKKSSTFVPDSEQ